MTVNRRLPFGMAQYRWRYHWLRKKNQTPTGPFYINVEPTSYCNIRCKICSYDYSRKPGYMDVGLFEKIIDQAANLNIHELAHFLAGEPLLHPELPYMIDYATVSGIESRLHTNGMLLTEEKSRALLDANLSFLGVSFDGDEAETYNEMRRGSDFDQVVDNLRTFLKLKRERGGERPYVALKVVKMEGSRGNGNGLEISPDFLKRFEGLPVDQFKVIHPHDWRGEVKQVVPHVAAGQCYYPCMVLWATMSIGWDGRVLGCAADLNGREVLGDLNQQSIMEIWNSDKMQGYRELHREGRYLESELCRNCTFVWWAKNPHLSFLAAQGWAKPVVGLGKAVLTGSRWVGVDRRTKSFK